MQIHQAEKTVKEFSERVPSMKPFCDYILDVGVASFGELEDAAENASEDSQKLIFIRYAVPIVMRRILLVSDAIPELDIEDVFQSAMLRVTTHKIDNVLRNPSFYIDRFAWGAVFMKYSIVHSQQEAFMKCIDLCNETEIPLNKGIILFRNVLLKSGAITSFEYDRLMKTLYSNKNDIFKEELSEDFTVESDAEVSAEKIMNYCDRFLSDREKNILKMSFESHTWEEIGKVYGVTRERVRQIYAKAMRKIRFLITDR